MPAWWIGMLALAGLAVPAAASRVPFVGCPADGQQGPQAAPRSGPTPDVPAAGAARLAWYQTGDGIGVLAPRGWHCFGAAGSAGMQILVAPRPLDWGVMMHETGIAGPAIQHTLSSGGTSGRFEVAAIAARLFPAAKAFVDGVAAEGLAAGPFPRRPYPADRITYRGPYQALFTTPAGADGLGLRSHLARGPLAIDGVAILHPEDDMDLDMLNARLAPADRPLVAYIIAAISGR